MKHELEAAGFEPGDKADVHLLWDDASPMIVLARVGDDEPAPPGLEDRRRTITERDRSLVIKPPIDIMEGDPELEGGLGLDRDTYDPENPLYFEPLIQDGTLGLIPLAYEDGTKFAVEYS